MKLTLPITGTVLVEGSVMGAGGLVGDNNDPIRPVSIDLGNVSWTIVEVDLENEVMVIEVKAGETVCEPTAGIDPKTGGPNYRRRPATKAEKIFFLQCTQDLVMNHTRDELYQMSKCPKLKRPFKKG